MASNPPKSVLCIGINPFKLSAADAAGAPPLAQIQAMLDRQVEEATAAGYDLTMKLIAPDEMEAEVPRVAEMLKGKRWDGFIIGGGIRNTIELTVYFERMVNAAREARPQTRMGFNTSPGDIVKTLDRMFGG